MKNTESMRIAIYNRITKVVSNWKRSGKLRENVMNKKINNNKLFFDRLLNPKPVCSLFFLTNFQRNNIFFFQKNTHFD